MPRETRQGANGQPEVWDEVSQRWIPVQDSQPRSGAASSASVFAPPPPPPSPPAPSRKAGQWLGSGEGPFGLDFGSGGGGPFSPLPEEDRLRPMEFAINPWAGLLSMTQRFMEPNSPEVAPAPPPPPPAIDFGEPQISPSDQRLIDTLTAARGASAPTPMQAPQLPTPPTITADPGLERIAQHMQGRAEQVGPLIQREIEALQQDDPAARSKWVRLGEMLSAIAARGDMSQAGLAVSEILQRDKAMQQELRRETLRLTLQGWGYEDAAVQAQANLLSGQHTAQMQTAQNAFERDLAQTDLQGRYDLQNMDNQGRYAARQTEMDIMLAQVIAEAENRAQTQHREAVGAFAGIPEYADQAMEALVPEGITDPNARAALASGLQNDQRAQGLRAYIVANIGDPQGLADYLYDFDPSQDWEGLAERGPDAVFFAALQSPTARQALASRPELAQYARYGLMGVE